MSSTKEVSSQSVPNKEKSSENPISESKEPGRKLQSLCRQCKKDKYTAMSAVLCCNCGISLCRKCAAKKCASKSHKLVNMNQAKSQQTKQASSPSSDTYSFCYHCKKRKDRTKAAIHCYDCGKSYCDTCAKGHSKNKSTYWHDLWNLNELFRAVEMRQERTVPSTTTVSSGIEILSSEKPPGKPVSSTDEPLVPATSSNEPLVPATSMAVVEIHVGNGEEPTEMIEKPMPDSEGLSHISLTNTEGSSQKLITSSEESSKKAVTSIEGPLEKPIPGSEETFEKSIPSSEGSLENLIPRSDETLKKSIPSSEGSLQKSITSSDGTLQIAMTNTDMEGKPLPKIGFITQNKEQIVITLESYTLTMTRS